MKDSCTLCMFLLCVLFLAGCTGLQKQKHHQYSDLQKQKYHQYSDGLPTMLQWKCNPAFGDVNGDGLLDLAAIPRKGDGTKVWINQGNGSWSEAIDGLLKYFSCGGGVDFGDIDGDGILDLAVGDHCGGLYVYKGDGTGKWSLSSHGLPKFQVDDIALGDFNRDGNLDLAACSSNNQGIRIFAGNGNGYWNQASSPGLPDTDDCHELALGDFNNDGILDLAATMNRQPFVWVGTAEGNWNEFSQGFPQLSWGGQYWGIAVGDVDKDGYLDLVLGRRAGGPEVYLSDGKGVWHPALNGLSVVQSAWGVALGDIDRDNHIDLVVSGKKILKEQGDAFGVFLFEGDGKGNWKYIKNSGLPQDGNPQSWGLVLADLDADGKPEIGECFGRGTMRLPPFMLESVEGTNIPEEFDTSGGVRVWKMD